MNGRKGSAISVVILWLLLSMPVFVHAKEEPADFPQESAGEDEKVVDMLDLLELMEFLKDMEVLAALEEE